jgi:putative copper export protein
MKILIVIALLAVLGALGSAGVFMLRKRKPGQETSPDKRMARALALRVAVSVALFVLILVAWRLGWIAPRGLPTGN